MDSEETWVRSAPVTASLQRVALGWSPQSLGEDAQAECEEAPRPRKPRKRRCLTWLFPSVEMHLGHAWSFTPDPGRVKRLRFTRCRDRKLSG